MLWLHLTSREVLGDPLQAKDPPQPGVQPGEEGGPAGAAAGLGVETVLAPAKRAMRSRFANEAGGNFNMGLYIYQH